MKVLKITKAGKWQDQSYQKQYGIEAGEEIEIGEGTIVVAGDGGSKLGKATCLSHSIADLMAKSGYGEIVTVEDAPDADDEAAAAEEKAKAEADEAEEKAKAEDEAKAKAEAEKAEAKKKAEVDQAAEDKKKSESDKGGKDQPKGK